MVLIMTRDSRPALAHLRPNSASTYTSHLRRHWWPLLGDRHIRSLTRSDMKSAVAALTGRIVQRNAFGDCWRTAVKSAGLPAGTRFHDLKHFYASALIAANLNPKVIQSRLGHATIAETMETCGHLFPDSEDLGRGAVDDALADAPAEQERNRGAR
jgi:integrase